MATLYTNKRAVMCDLPKLLTFKQTFLRGTKQVWITTIISSSVFIVEEFQPHYRLKKKWCSIRRDYRVTERATLMEVGWKSAQIRNNLWLISIRSPKAQSNRNRGPWFQERSDKMELGKENNSDLQFRRSTKLRFIETSSLNRIIWCSKW